MELLAQVCAVSIPVASAALAKGFRMATGWPLRAVRWLTNQTGEPGVVTRSGKPAQAGQSRGDERTVFVSRELSKVYHMGDVDVVALRSVDLEIREGEFIVLLGPSGSGKSTLLNILGGLDTPTGGEAWFRDHNLVGASEALLTQYRRDHVGFVFQFYNLIPSLTVLENIALVTEIAVNPMRPEDALRLVGLDQRLDHFPSQLSGGEQQRVAIARAIAKQPDVLRCDEPTGALDYRTGIVVLSAIARVNRTLGTTAIVITHNAAIAGMADRVVHLADGTIARIDVNERRLDPEEISW